MIKKTLFLTLIFLLSANGFAKELKSLYRGARATAMGGAYVALADDEQAVFLNPAGIAGVKYPTIHTAPTLLDVSSDTYAVWASSSDTLLSFDASAINAVMGRNVYARAQLTPTFLFRGLAISLLFDWQGAFYSKNKALPFITFGHQTTTGIQAAFGFRFGKKRPRVGDPEFRVGIAGKVLWRRGGYRIIPATELLSIIGGGANTLLDRVGSFGMGIGVDVGAQGILPLTKKLELRLGTAILDVGDTAFASTADPVEMNWSAGAAFVYDMFPYEIKLAYDFSHILADADWRQKNHLGLDFSIKPLSIFAGINQAYFTAGASFDIIFLKVTALTYAQELGTLIRQDANRRYMLSLDMKFEL